MTFTDRYGTIFPNSVWLPLNVIPVFYPKQYALVTFLGFATPEAARAALRSATTGGCKMPDAIGFKEYRATPEAVRAFARAGAEKPTRLEDLWELAYAAQRDGNDVVAPRSDDQSRAGDFFSEAEWVQVEVP